MKGAALLLLALILFSGCEKKYEYVSRDANVSLESKEARALVKRYEDYWEAKSKGEYDKSYRFELPYLNFLKHVRWYEQFHAADRKFYHVTLLYIEWDDKHPGKAKVRTKIDLKNNTYSFFDVWYSVNNRWYHTYSQSILPTLPENQ